METIILNQVDKNIFDSLFNDWRFYFSLMVTGVFTGMGTAIGSYFANKGILETIKGGFIKLTKGQEEIKRRVKI